MNLIWAAPFISISGQLWDDRGSGAKVILVRTWTFLQPITLPCIYLSVSHLLLDDRVRPD